jgi:high-affinity iron transporter
VAPAFLLSLREGLEAALIVSVTMGVLVRTRRTELLPAAWLGVALAAGLSVLTALALSWIGAELEGPTEQVFEGTTMIVAAALLTWMILWMRAQGREIHQRLEADVRRTARAGHRRAVFAITFLAVLREGVETALFLTAASFRADAAGTLVGGLGGLAASAILGWGLFKTTLRLDLRRFFQVTGFLLLLFAAGLVAQGVHEFNEAGLIPTLREPIWDLSQVLGETTPAGSLLKALFGYNANPSLTEALAYVGYLVTLALALRPARPKSTGMAPAPNP